MTIAAADILKAFNFRHATKSFDAAKKGIRRRLQHHFGSGPLIAELLWLRTVEVLVIERQDIKDKLISHRLGEPRTA